MSECGVLGCHEHYDSNIQIRNLQKKLEYAQKRWDFYHEERNKLREALKGLMDYLPGYEDLQTSDELCPLLKKASEVLRGGGE